MKTPASTPMPLRIHLRHVRAVDPAAGALCTPSIRVWCRRYGIDLRTLCEDGIDITAHPQLHDDPFVVRAIAIARAEAAGLQGVVDAS